MTVDRYPFRGIGQAPAAPAPAAPAPAAPAPAPPAPAPSPAARGRGRHRVRVHAPVPWVPVIGALAVPLGVGAALWVSTRVHLGQGAHGAVLFAHLACLVFGFGAVLSVDWVATLWLLGGRSLTDVLRTARNAHLPAWLGYAGLLATGALLEPDLTSWLTRTKLALVVLIGWNGVVATLLQAPLAHGVDRPDRRLVRWCVVMAGLSQLGWWGAMAIGFLNTRSA